MTLLLGHRFEGVHQYGEHGGDLLVHESAQLLPARRRDEVAAGTPQLLRSRQQEREAEGHGLRDMNQLQKGEKKRR